MVWAFLTFSAVLTMYLLLLRYPGVSDLQAAGITLAVGLALFLAIGWYRKY